MNIAFWNCQGLRPKRKELQNYLLENQIDILALNETFLKPKFKFHLPGYDIYKNDRLVGTKGGVAEIVKCRFWRKLPLLWHANAIDEN